VLFSFFLFHTLVPISVLFQLFVLFFKITLQLGFYRYEKLQRWDDAFKAYTAKAAQATTPHALLDATLGVYLTDSHYYS